MLEREHLPRLAKVWVKNPIYFLTACTLERRRILTTEGIPPALIVSWRVSGDINGWSIGRYVVMPDHVHFFAKPALGAKSLGEFMLDWQRWTAGAVGRVLQSDAAVWQPEFVDHPLRSPDSYNQKWDYVCQNPVRAGLVGRAEDWPHAGVCESLML